MTDVEGVAEPVEPPPPAAAPAGPAAIGALVVTLSLGALRNRWRRR